MIGRPLYYRRDGTPYTGKDAALEWASDCQKPKLKIVKQENLANGVRVSTVWLGLDHSFSEKRPQIFETMVFFSGYKDEECWHYATEEEAIRAHKMLVKKWGAYKTADEILRSIKKSPPPREKK